MRLSTSTMTGEGSQHFSGAYLLHLHKWASCIMNIITNIIIIMFVLIHGETVSDPSCE